MWAYRARSRGIERNREEVGVERKWRKRGTSSKISFFASFGFNEGDSHFDEAKSEMEEAEDVSSRKKALDSSFGVPRRSQSMNRSLCSKGAKRKFHRELPCYLIAQPRGTLFERSP